MLHSKENLILAKYRLKKAASCLMAAKILIDDELFEDSANRSYYAIFHSINALCAIDGVGFKKHAGVLSYFNQEYIKTGKIEVEFAKISKNAFSTRTKSDYSDFFVASQGDVIKQYEDAVKFHNRIKMYFDNTISFSEV